jgi:hypothetical protein
MRHGPRWLGLVVLTALLSSCSQLAPSVPGAPSVPASQPPTTQSAPTSPVGSPVRQVSAAAKSAKAELGVQIFWHDVHEPELVRDNATKLLDYVVGLGANSVGISFPIYTDGARPTKVYIKDGNTPTPDSLQVVVGAAKARGLRVLMRPIIDEVNIKATAGAWRGTIAPRTMATWFDSYLSVLTPYLVAGQAAGADSFAIGTEMDSLVGQSVQWGKVLKAAAAVFHGRLAYADNWGAWATGRPGVAGAARGLDAYPQLHLADSATEAQIAAAWVAWFQKRPAELTTTVVQEVGIPATPGAYKEPASWSYPGQTLAPQIQAKWFAGACAAVRTLHMAGIYFWDIDAWADPAKAANYTAGSFMGRGDTAIATCFASRWPGQ